MKILIILLIILGMQGGGTANTVQEKPAPRPQVVQQMKKPKKHRNHMRTPSAPGPGIELPAEVQQQILERIRKLEEQGR